MNKVKYKILGMDCSNCAKTLELDLEDAGIKCKCSFSNSTLEVDGKHDPKKVIETVKKSGYSILSD
jgi:copper chaperone CopZ